MDEIVILHYEQVLQKNWMLLKEAAEQRNIRIISWEPHRVNIICENNNYYPLYDGEKVNPKAILHRTVFRFGGVILPALQYWSNLGTLVVNKPEEAFRSRDKLATTIELCKAGVPIIPTTGFVRADKNTFIHSGDNKVIVKPAYGVKGEGIHLFSSTKTAIKALANAEIDKNFLPLDYYVAQPFIDVNGKDIRAFVVDGKCVAIMQRQAKKGEFRANLANDATGVPLSLNHPASQTAIDAINACKLDYGGVDMIEDKDGTIRILEVDAWAGFAGITQVTGIDVAGMILDMVLNRIKKGEK